MESLEDRPEQAQKVLVTGLQFSPRTAHQEEEPRGSAAACGISPSPHAAFASPTPVPQPRAPDRRLRLRSRRLCSPPRLRSTSALLLFRLRSCLLVLQICGPACGVSPAAPHCSPASRRRPLLLLAQASQAPGGLAPAG